MEHMHANEEICYCLEGSGYFDVRNKDNQWIWIWIKAGDLIICRLEYIIGLYLTPAMLLICSDKLISNSQSLSIILLIYVSVMCSWWGCLWENQCSQHIIGPGKSSYKKGVHQGLDWKTWSAVRSSSEFQISVCSLSVCVSIFLCTVYLYLHSWKFLPSDAPHLSSVYGFGTLIGI